MTHEVYIGRVANRIVYIGEGRSNRHKHLNSGTSNVYEANKFHFEGGVIDVELIPCNSKESAQQLEAELLSTYNPVWNKIGTDHYEKRKTLAKTLDRFRPIEDWQCQHYSFKLLLFASKLVTKDSDFYMTEQQAREFLGIADKTKRILSDSCKVNPLHYTVSRHDVEGTRLPSGHFYITVNVSGIQSEEYQRFLERKIKRI